MLKNLKKIYLMVICLTASSCLSRSIQVSSGCLEFCEQIPEPKSKMFKQNLSNDTFNFLIEIHNLKHCGCLTEQSEIVACQEKYQVK